MLTNLLSFSWSQLITDTTGIITSLISFVTDNTFLVMLVGIPLVLGLIFSIVAFFRR